MIKFVFILFNFYLGLLGNEKYRLLLSRHFNSYFYSFKLISNPRKPRTFEPSKLFTDCIGKSSNELPRIDMGRVVDITVFFNVCDANRCIKDKVSRSVEDALFVFFPYIR